MKEQWTYSLFSIHFGKGSALEIWAKGMGKDLYYRGEGISFDLRKLESYESIPKRRKLVMESKYKCDLAHTTGICWICGEIHPRVIEGHHLYESRSNNKHGNTLRTDFLCGICANCHRKHKVTGGETERHQIAILNAIEQEWFGLGGDMGDEV